MSDTPLQQLLDLADGQRTVGASESDIRAVEQELGVALPAAYRRFLEVFGRDRDGVWCGSDCFVDDIVRNTKSLPHLLADNGLSDCLPDRYVCVFTHQGYIAVWFAVPADADDPPAFIYNEAQQDLGVQPKSSLIQILLDDYAGLSSA